MKSTSKSSPRLHKPGVTGSSPVAANYIAERWGDAWVFRGVPDTVYFSWPELSASDLKDAESSPVRFYERKILGTAPKRTGAALDYGRLLHSWHELLVGLDDSPFWDTCELAPDEFVGTTGNLLKKGDEWLAGLAAGKRGLTSIIRDRLWKQTRQILANTAATDLIERRIEPELSMKWTIGQHAMRGRIDGLTESTFYDLKTTSDETPLTTFWRSVLNYKYDLQCAVYGSAAQACHFPPHPLHFIVTQNDYPYACHVVTLPASVIAKAHARMLRLLDDIAERAEWGSWLPSDYGTVTELECPAFMKGEGNGWGE